jgi:anti-sigma regulatory factor (Ser/Thr protein kinase)
MVHTQSLSLLARNAHSAPFVELRQSLPSKVAAISPFTDQLMRFILNFRSMDGGEGDIEMALHEALANAVIHGNGENSSKRVYVTCRCYMDGEVAITVRDEGKGFDSSTVFKVLACNTSSRRPHMDGSFAIRPRLGAKSGDRESHHSIQFLGERLRVSSWGLCFRQCFARFSYDPS